jgi:hypothetical protein
LDDVRHMAEKLTVRRLRILYYSDDMDRPGPKYYMAQLISYVWFVLLIIVVVAGIISEALALYALYRQSDNMVIREIVLWSMFALLALLSIRPIAAIYKAAIGGAKEADQALSVDHEPDEGSSSTPSS